MNDQFERTELLIGENGINRLENSRVAVFGVGGVGGYTVEALARSGIGTLDIIDNDRVDITNINRQIIALHSTVGQLKVDVAEKRIHDINPEAKVNKYNVFYSPETADMFDFSKYDYVVDAIDTVTGKIQLVMQAQSAGVPIISSMGAGNKLDAAAFEVTDIYKTSVCPLARVMRTELKKRGIKKLKVVYSKEQPLVPIQKSNEVNLPVNENANSDETATLNGKIFTAENEFVTNGSITTTVNDIDKSNEIATAENEATKNSETAGDETKAATMKTGRRQTPGSMAFVPSVAGLIIAGEVIKDLIR